MSGGVSHHQSEYLGAIAMKVAVASDHRGYHLKEKVIALLKSKGHEVLDEGPATDESVDYPDFAALVASKVSANAVDRGVLICGTGLGMAIAANKFPRVRAAACVDEVTAELSRRHNDVNVLCLSGDLLSSRSTERLVEIWMGAEFEGGRHQRRLDKILELERQDRGN
jgi:ribose 5-phosphate isomerase B